MTIDDFVKIGALRSGMRQYAEKRDRAIRLCEEQFRTHKRPYVAISGGKDSVAMAYIVDAAARRVGADYRLWLRILQLGARVRKGQRFMLCWRSSCGEQETDACR